MSSELDDLKKELKALKDQINPPPREPYKMPRFDPTEGMCMPRNALQAMLDAVPESVMRELRADARKPNPVTGGQAPPPTNQKRGTGWVEERKIEPPPGIRLMDQMMDEQDRRDKVEFAKKLAETEAALKAAKRSGGK